MPTAATLQDELDLEHEMVDQGRIRYWGKVDNAVKRGRRSTAPGPAEIVIRGIEPLATSIREWLAAEKIKMGPKNAAYVVLHEMDPEVAAVLATRVVLDMLVESPKYQRLSVKIGRAIEQERRYAAFEAQAPQSFSGPPSGSPSPGTPATASG